MSKAKEEDILDTGRLGDIRKRLSQNLPSEWQLTTLGEAFKWGSGGTPKRTDTRFYGGDIPWLIIGDLNEGVVTDSETTITEKGLKESSAKWVEPGSILLAMYGSIGKLGIAGRRLTTNQAIAFTKPDPVDTKYLFYYLMYTRGDLASLGKGATQKNISQTVIKAFPFVLAPQDQQIRIVAEIEKQFSRLDEAVANLKRVKANLKRYKAAVLKAAVEGRLVETEAELARKKTPSPLTGEGGGEGASYETGAQLLQRILETRRSQWKGKGKYKEPAAPDATDLPELPEGWVWASTEQLGHIQLGRQRSPKNRSKDNPVKYIRAANITERGLELEDMLDMEFSPDEQDRYRLRRGDLVLSEASGSPDQVGKPAVWQDQLPLCCFQNTVIRLRPAIEMSQYLFTCFQTYYINGVFAKVAGGVGINHLSADKFSRVQASLPPLVEQYRIVAEVDRRLSLIREVEAQVDANIQRAERLRQSILGRAFSGKLVCQNNASDSAHLAWPMAADDCGKYEQSAT